MLEYLHLEKECILACEIPIDDAYLAAPPTNQPRRLWPAYNTPASCGFWPIQAQARPLAIYEANCSHPYVLGRGGSTFVGSILGHDDILASSLTQESVHSILHIFRTWTHQVDDDSNLAKEAGFEMSPKPPYGWSLIESRWL